MDSGFVPTNPMLVTLQDGIRYTTGRHSLSVDRCVRFLPFLQRSISDLCQLEYPQSLNNPPLEMYRKGFFCHLCLFSFLTAFSARSAAVFSNFAVANHQMRRRGFWECSCSDGVSLKKRRHFVIPCHRKHPKTPAFAQRFPATAGTAPKQAEKELYFPTLSVPPEASAGICP